MFVISRRQTCREGTGPRGRFAAGYLLVLTFAVLIGGCEPNADHQQSASSQPNHAGQTPSTTPKRIVCLVPAITQMIVDLDLSDHLVGVGHPDPASPPVVPSMGNYLDVDAESMLAADPDLVITLRGKDSPSARLKQLAEQGDFALAAYPYPQTIEDVTTTLTGPMKSKTNSPDHKTLALGTLLAVKDRAQALRRKTQTRLQHLRDQYAHSPTPSVLLCIQTGPVMASGPGTVHSQLLTLVHAKNAALNANLTAPTYDRESLTALSPDVIVLLMPNARPLTDHDPRLAEFRGLPIPAVGQNRIRLINDPKCQLPSTNLPRIARKLAKAVHE